MSSPDLLILTWCFNYFSSCPHLNNTSIFPSAICPCNIVIVGILIPPCYLRPTPPHWTPRSAQQAVDSAYSDYLDVVVSFGLQARSSLSLDTPMRLSLQSEARRHTRMYLCKARGMLRKMPGFFFSGYSQAAASQPVLVRMDSYQRLMKDAILSDLGVDELPQDYILPEPPKQRLNIRLRSGATSREREDLLNGVRVFFKSDATLAMNVEALLATTQTAIDMLNVFFQVVGAIAMIMCFFILWLSFVANVRENAWEFGVLRSIGLNVGFVVRCNAGCVFCDDVLFLCV